MKIKHFFWRILLILNVLIQIWLETMLFLSFIETSLRGMRKAKWWMVVWQLNQLTSKILFSKWLHRLHFEAFAIHWHCWFYDSFNKKSSFVSDYLSLEKCSTTKNPNQNSFVISFQIEDYIHIACHLWCPWQCYYQYATHFPHLLTDVEHTCVLFWRWQIKDPFINPARYVQFHVDWS